MQTAYFAHAQGFNLHGVQYYLGNVVDPAAEKARIHQELAKIAAEMQKISTKLQNPDFANKAPAAVVEKERQRLQNFTEQKALLDKDLNRLK